MTDCYYCGADGSKVLCRDCSRTTDSYDLVEGKCGYCGSSDVVCTDCGHNQNQD